MKFSFVFGFILLILLIVGVFVGLPYAIQELRSGSFSLPVLFPRVAPKSASNYFFSKPPISTSTPVKLQAVKKVAIYSVSRYGPDAIGLQSSYFSDQNEKINITGWKIKSAQRGETIIGKGINLPQFEVAVSDIWLSTGGKADIAVGLSPLAVNFRSNKCFDWLNNLYGLGQNTNYNNCVVDHLSDSDFYKEWKIYTGNSNQIYDPLHDIIELRDQNGILIDRYEY